MRHARYALLSGAHVLALCTDVDGLFAEPAPPARARYELRGCEPRGALARAVTQAVVEGSAPYGELLVRTADGVSALPDARVLASAATSSPWRPAPRPYGSATAWTASTASTSYGSLPSRR